jgi:short-subunit dehydrogenase
MFSRCLYAELRPEGIGVTGLIPGGANTGFQSNCGIGNCEWDDSESLRPEHIAHAALSVATMPNGAFVPEIIIYGKSQEIIPF